MANPFLERGDAYVYIWIISNNAQLQVACNSTVDIYSQRKITTLEYFWQSMGGYSSLLNVATLDGSYTEDWVVKLASLLILYGISTHIIHENIKKWNQWF